jgi:hypothetical protein
MASAGLTYALNNGMTADQYYQNIFDFVLQNQGMSDADLRSVMDQYGISPTDVAQATGTKPEAVQQRYEAIPVTAPEPVYTPPAPPPSLLETPPEAPVETPAYVAPVETPAYVAPVVAPVVTPPVVTPPVAAPVTAPVGLLESPVVTPPVTTGSNMATSAALNYALNNGMTQEQFDKRIFDAVLAAQQPGSTTTNAMLRTEMDRLGISTEDVARATGVSTQSVAEKYAAATPTTKAELEAKAAADADLLARQRQEAARLATVATPPVVTTPVVTPPVVTPPVVTTPVVKPPVVTPPVVKPPVTTPATNTALNAQLEKAYKDGDIALLNSLLAQNQVTSAQAKNMFNLTDADLSWIQNNAGGKFYAPPTATPGTNMGIGGSFANFQSIPIGAQYNPAVTAGGASPYSQIMGQMRPFTNPYQNFVANTPMGGYDPGLYDRIEAANLAKATAEAEIARLGGTNVYSSGDSGGDGGGTGGDGGGTGAGAGTGNAMAKGGYVHGGLMFGANPPGPDDGAVNLDLGEYVIKKSSVNKYGRGLLDMINEGKVPAKKMKSLLG